MLHVVSCSARTVLAHWRFRRTAICECQILSILSKAFFVKCTCVGTFRWGVMKVAREVDKLLYASVPYR